MASNAEMIHLYRSPMARLTGKKEAGMWLEEAAKQNQPAMSEIHVDEENQVEHWQVEKQFWLKYKKAFQEFGYLPLIKMNDIKGIPHMLENY